MSSDDAFRTGQDIRDRAFRFACRIVKFCEALYQAGGIARLMAPQLLDSGTALFPMLEKARGRLRLHEACNVGPADEATNLRTEANELVAIVTRIVGNTKTNAGVTATSRKPRPSYMKTIPNSQFPIPNF